jgi:hypothetical protein
VGDVAHVDAAGGDVRGDEGVDAARVELGEGALALALGLVAVHGDRGEVVLGQALDQAVGAVLGAHEHERAPALALEARDEGVDLALVVDLEEAVLDGALVGLGVLVLVAAGVAGVGVGQAAGLAVERRGEHDGLAVGGDLLDDAVDRRAEAHVEHAVGLVEDERADVAQGERAAVEQVLQAAGGGHEDVGLRRELGLLHEAGAAVDGGDAERAGVGERAQLLDDLERELAGRGEDEGGRAAGLRGGAVDHRQAEGEGLARARSAT